MRRLTVLDLPVDRVDPIVRLDNLEPETRRLSWFEIEENSEGQSVISVKQEACSNILGVALARPPMVVVVDDADVIVEAVAGLHCEPSPPKGLGEFELETGLHRCCLFGWLAKLPPEFCCWRLFDDCCC